MPKKQSKKKKEQDSSSYTGTLDITRSGMGYVIVDKLPNDIMIRPSDFNTALHGDTVKVKVTGNGSKTGRQQGQVLEVVKRKQIEFLGKLQIGKNFAFFIADVDKPMPDIYIPLDKTKDAKEADRVVVRIT